MVRKNEGKDYLYLRVSDCQPYYLPKAQSLIIRSTHSVCFGVGRLSVQQTFTKLVLCALHSARYWAYTGEQDRTYPSWILSFSRKHKVRDRGPRGFSFAQAVFPSTTGSWQKLHKLHLLCPAQPLPPFLYSHTQGNYDLRKKNIKIMQLGT